MTTRSLANRPGRGGITINDRGDQGVIGFWPEQYDSATPTSWVGRLRGDFGAVVQIAQRHHQQNEAVKLAKTTKRPLALPEPDVRASLARAEQKKLADLHHRVATIADEAFLAKAKLKPFEYGAGVIDAMNRQELRAALRAMPDDKRSAALRSHAYRAAALEQPPELSGIPASLHTQLHDMEIAAKYPDIVNGSTEAAEAVEVVRQAIKTAGEAVKNELLASGVGVIEAVAPIVPRAWA